MKSFNFKLYYSEGGNVLAKNLINNAESSLEDMENFLGTRLVEQIDIYLTEPNIYNDESLRQRNGMLLIDNSSIYLTYKGNTQQIVDELKTKLAVILINGMLYGNTIKDRLKNNREVNVPNWFVSGLSRFVSGKKEANTSWMADYFEGKLKLNLNLTDPNELGEFGHSVFKFVNDSFGVNKLRQLLFYTKITGKADYASEYVLNKSLNWVIADWYKLQKNKFLMESKERLPNEPEVLDDKINNSEIIEIKFTADGKKLNILIITNDGVEIWDYDISTKKSQRKFKKVAQSKTSLWRFINSNDELYLVESNGILTNLYKLDNYKITKTYELNFNYVFAIKSNPIEGFNILAQRNFIIDIYHIKIKKELEIINITQNQIEETDFIYDKNGGLIISEFRDSAQCVYKMDSETVLFKSIHSMSHLTIYNQNFISFLLHQADKNVAMIISPNHTSSLFQLTNYSRSIFFYDYNLATNKVLEALYYGKKNYIVISEATIDSVKPKIVEKFSPIVKVVIPLKDTLKIFGYQFLTGFEYQQTPKNIIESSTVREQKTVIRIKEIRAPKHEFKPSAIAFAFTNSQFNSTLFASFFPIKQGLNNGFNVNIGCHLMNINKKYLIGFNIRQPLIGRGTDFDASVKKVSEKITNGLLIYNSVYQAQQYNQDFKYTTQELRLFKKIKWHPRYFSTTTLGLRVDTKWPLSTTVENVERPIVKIIQPNFQHSFDILAYSRSRLNYTQKLLLTVNIHEFKRIKNKGLTSNLLLKVKFDQTLYRIFNLSTRIIAYNSSGQNRTVFLLGGAANWVRPSLANASVFDQKVGMYSSTSDFQGLPYNFKAGNSAVIGKFIFSMPINPIISQQNFNQNFYKYLVYRGYFNIGSAWFGTNPFSINNPENKDIIETGSLSITNYIAKNPLVWSYGMGVNSILFGYEIGFDYAIGYNELGLIGKYGYFTIGKEF